MFKLFYSPGSCALATHIVLEEVGAPYAAVRVDFSQNEQQSPAFLALNPKGRVPALVTPRGVLTETPALLLFLAQSYPAAALAPLDDPFALAEQQAFHSYLCSTVHVAHAHRMRAYRWADDPAAHEAMRRKVASNVTACFTLIEHEHLRGPWVWGERYSLSDPYLFTLAGWLAGDGVDMRQFPKVAAHFALMLERPAVKRALAMQMRRTDG